MKRKLLTVLLVLTLAVLCIPVAFAVGNETDEPAVQTDAPVLDVVARNLSLKDNVHLVFYVTYENVSATDVKLLVWANPQQSYAVGTQTATLETVGTTTYQGKTCLLFYYKDLTTKQMADNVYVRAYTEQGGVDYYSEGVTKFSVLEYAYTKLGKIGNSTVATGYLPDLLEAMLYYGGLAQKHFNYNTARNAADDFYEVKLDGAYLSEGTASGLYLPGDTVELTAPMVNDDGGRFIEWVDKTGNSVSAEPSFIYTITSENVELKPRYAEPEYYTVAFVDYNGSVLNEIQVKKGMKISDAEDFASIVDPVRASYADDKHKIVYTFCNWMGANGENIDTIVDAPITLVAQYNETHFYLVSFYNYDTTVWSQIWVEVGMKILPVPADPTRPDDDMNRYTFVGWMNANGDTIDTIVTGPIKLNAIYQSEPLLKESLGLAYELSSDESYYIVTGIGTCTDTDVVIPETYEGKPIKEIADGAFRAKKDLKSIIIPNSVISIGERVFQDCSSLENITIPASVKSLGNAVFYACNGLMTVTFAENSQLTSLGEAVFYDCINLKSIVIPNGVTCIDIYAFRGCIGLESVTIPNSVTSIGKYAFYNCSELESITIPSSVKSLGTAVFRECGGLMTVTFAENSQLTSIGEYAFYNCAKLREITIPKGVTSIGDHAFRCCNNLAKITFAEDSNLKTIGVNAFWECGFESIAIPSGLTQIEKSAFAYCENLTAVYITDIAAWCNIEFLDRFANPLYYAHNLYLNTTLVTELVIPETVTGIGNCAFYGCSSFESVTISGSVTNIGDAAFYECNRISSVEFAERSQLTNISQVAFYGCANIETIIIPSGVTNIANGVFSGCSNLKSVTFSDVSQITSIGNSTFSSCDSLTSITIPNSVTSIGDFAFFDCSSLTGITIPSSVTSIGEYAFHKCSSLTNVTFAENSQLTRIGEAAFYMCTGLTAVYITDIATWCEIDFVNISSNPLYHAHDLYLNSELITDLIIPETVTSIKDYAFYKCIKIKNVILSSNVTSLGAWSFGQCVNMRNITIPNSVTSIGDYAFEACINLKSVTIPSSVTNIGSSAFDQCHALTSITIPSSVTRIGAYAFYRCDLLTSVTFENTGGWTAGDTAIDSTALADKSTAATYLTSTYKTSTWTRSE